MFIGSVIFLINQSRPLNLIYDAIYVNGMRAVNERKFTTRKPVYKYTGRVFKSSLLYLVVREGN